ncbi:hypothetical protein HDU77_006578 [Chytriomyces hyalinus]|nr:hypothetical protein HDU77_006578 [Chytriomyces hyalinus]
MSRWIIAATAIGLGAVHALTTKLDPPQSTLLARHAKDQEASATPMIDLFQMRLPKTLFQTPSLAEYAKSFAYSPVFSLERLLLKATLVAKDISVPDRFEVGDRLAAWRVIGRLDDKHELLMAWGHDWTPINGTTYFKLVDEADSVKIQFGSGLMLPNGTSVNPVVMHLHGFYSRCLIFNTAATLLARQWMVSKQ